MSKKSISSLIFRKTDQQPSSDAARYRGNQRPEIKSAFLIYCTLGLTIIVGK